MRAQRGSLLLAFVAAFVGLSSTAHARSPTFTRPIKQVRLAVVIVPDADVLAVSTGMESGFGLGVFPDSRNTLDFWSAVAAGAPTSTAGRPSPLEGRECALRDALQAANAGRYLGAIGGREGAEVLRRLFCDEVAGYDEDVARAFAVVGLAVPDRQTAAGVLREFKEKLFFADGASIIVAGAGGSTPVPISLSVTGTKGILAGGIARRPAIVTPYDVSATILSRLAIAKPASGFTGKVLRVDPERDPAAAVASLASRLVRDANYGPAVAGSTIGVLLGGGVVLPFALLLLAFLGLAGASRFAVRAAIGAAAAVSGYVASLFVPSANAGVRTIPIVAAYVLAFALPFADPVSARRRIGILLGIAAAGIAALTVASAIRPGGEPALSLYGNPLVSWRLFGLRNHLTSMLSLGVLAGAALAMRKPSALLYALLGAAGVFVSGSVILGANFVAVLTLSFGVALATWILKEGRVRLIPVITSAVLAALAFGGALLADAGSPASHGGQAVERVRSGGFDAAMEFLRIRGRLNLDGISAIWGGWVWAIGLAFALIAIMAWCVRDAKLDTGPRAVMFAGSAAALAALVMEDTGFLTGGIIALAPSLVATTLLAERLTLRRPLSPAGAAADTRPPLPRSVPQ